jgi:hypothetical protein
MHDRRSGRLTSVESRICILFLYVSHEKLDISRDSLPHDVGLYGRYVILCVSNEGPLRSTPTRIVDSQRKPYTYTICDVSILHMDTSQLHTYNISILLPLNYSKANSTLATNASHTQTLLTTISYCQSQKSVHPLGNHGIVPLEEKDERGKGHPDLGQDVVDQSKSLAQGRSDCVGSRQDPCGVGSLFSL